VTLNHAQAAAWLERNTVDSLPQGGLELKLASGRQLRVKLGIDPTAPDIHLGFTVVLQKLREFQDLGHTIVLIIGDYTARVGDPSGRTTTRPVLSGEEIDANAETFRKQALKVLSQEGLEVVRNGDWLDMSMSELFRLMGTTTVAQVLEREDFAKRYSSGASISMLELLYPLLQGYDSVAVRADVELGGTDQKFNLLLARDIQRHYGQPEQVIMTVPLLTGTDGARKMSKSYGNYIGIDESPEEIYGKTVSIPDESLESWYSLLLGGEPPKVPGPWEAKRALARTLVDRFHGAAAAQTAEEAFDRVHRRRELPTDVPVLRWGSADRSQAEETSGADGVDATMDRSGNAADRTGMVHLPAMLARAFGVSTSEARRSIAAGGVRLDGRPVPADSLDLPAGQLDGRMLQLGKRRFVRVEIDDA
jgi:tyrosyl-tRNA synthetase